MKPFERHGATRGRKWTPEYKAYQNMIGRCYDKKNKCYADYGGRGITVYRAWRNSFTRFLAHVGLRPTAKHSLDRKNNNRGYVPGNVQWATPQQQARNTRANRIVTVDGISKSLADWTGTTESKTYSRTKARLLRGWLDKKALAQPARALRAHLPAQAREKIRKLYATGEWTQRELADLFGLRGGQGNISRLLAGKYKEKTA